MVENQLGQIFDPSDVDFGLAGAITGYSITAGGDYVQLTSNNLIALNPSFDPDDDNTTQFTFTVTATDGVTTADHTVTVDVTLVVDTPPTLVLGLIDITDNDVDDLLILTQEMINYEDSNDGITDADVYYILSGAVPSWVDILRITDDDPEVSNPTTENVLSFSHQDVVDGRIAIKVTDLDAVEHLNVFVSNSFYTSKEAFQVDVRRDTEVDDVHSANTLDYSTSPFAVKVNAGAGHDTIIGSSGSDIITGGRGNDQIDLSHGGQDTVFFEIDSDGVFYNKDDSDTITGFNRQDDKLIFVHATPDADLRDFEDFLTRIKGADDTWGTGDDEMTVSLLLGRAGEDVTVTGLNFNFKHSGQHQNGFSANPNFTLMFRPRLIWFFRPHGCFLIF